MELVFVTGVVCAPAGRYEAELSSTRSALDDAIKQIALVSTIVICSLVIIRLGLCLLYQLS